MPRGDMDPPGSTEGIFLWVRIFELLLEIHMFAYVVGRASNIATSDANLDSSKGFPPCDFAWWVYNFQRQKATIWLKL